MTTTATKTTVELQINPPWYVTLSTKTSLPTAILIGAWGLVWAFGGLSAYFNPRFPPAFVTFLSLGWVPIALANFILMHFTGRFHMRMMDEAARSLNQQTHEILCRIDSDMRERLELPPAQGPTLQ